MSPFETHIPLFRIYPNDIFFLLLLSFAYALIHQSYLYFQHQRPKTADKILINQVIHYRKLVQAGRSKGPSAFVETSKFERQLLKYEKQWNTNVSQQKKDMEIYQKRKKKIGLCLYAVIFLFYYGIYLLQIDGFQVMQNKHDGNNIESAFFKGGDDNTVAYQFLKEFLWPMHYTGVGIRLANFSHITNSSNPRWTSFNSGSGLGALVIFWAGEITTDALLECIFGYLLRL